MQNLLSFARQRTPQKQEVDIRKIVDETLARASTIFSTISCWSETMVDAFGDGGSASA